MKRSEINNLIIKAENVFEDAGIALPPFAKAAPLELLAKSSTYSEFFNNKLGWLYSHFRDYGVIRLIIRRGDSEHDKFRKPYSEDVFLLESEKSIPPHYHISRMHDIVNVGRNALLVRIIGLRKTLSQSPTTLRIRKDGVSLSVPVGGFIKLERGESVTISEGCIHELHAPNGDCAVKTISTFSLETSDDVYTTDDRPLKSLHIEEDESPYRLISGDMYRNIKGVN